MDRIKNLNNKRKPLNNNDEKFIFQNYFLILKKMKLNSSISVFLNVIIILSYKTNMIAERILINWKKKI